MTSTGQKQEDSLTKNIGNLLTVNLKLHVITDGDNYFIRGEIESVQLGPVPVNLEDMLSGEDTVLVKRSSNIAYSFRDRTASTYETRQLEEINFSSANSEKKSFFKQFIDSTMIMQNSAFPTMVTPSPQITGNKFGITEVQSKKNQKISCSLLSVNEVEFSFSNLYTRAERFVKSEIKLPFPF
jgi:hypothetical protein